jgi:hypothetical protein
VGRVKTAHQPQHHSWRFGKEWTALYRYCKYTRIVPDLTRNIPNSRRIFFYFSADDVRKIVPTLVKADKCLSYEQKWDTKQV